MKNLIKNRVVQLIVVLLIGLLFGWLIFGSSSSSENKNHSHEMESADEVWTCSMHPQIRKSEAGDCPICGMDLIPVETDDNSEENPDAIRMSPTAMQLANVQTAVVQSGAAIKNLSLTGKITPDERAVYSQTSHISGRIERLNVNYTGESVKKGQVVATLYSPELTTAQEELMIAFQNKELQPELLKAAKQKLINWKLTDKQINNIIKSGKVMNEFPVLSDLNGVVTEIVANKGDYLKQGESFYEVADLSKLWVLLDIHESELAWIKKGDVVQFNVKAYPNEKFEGKVSFIDPVINSATRVSQARIELNNSSGKFKPQMLVNAVIENTLQTESISIVVPKSAVMWTGERSIVYVKTTSKNGLHFLMREVDLGVSLGDSYLINNGLVAGEEIAVNGTFSIDAAAQLAGKRSMMNPEGSTMNMGHNHGSTAMEMDDGLMNANAKKVDIDEKAKEALVPVFKNYFELKNALTQDDFDKATMATKAIQNSLKKVDMKLFKNDAHQVWMDISNELKMGLKKAEDSKDIGQIRADFIGVSETMITLYDRFQPLKETLYVQHCPMADNNRGADWLSKEKVIKNPYFGSSMLNCGEVKP